MGRRPRPTSSNLAYAAETIPVAAANVVTAYAEALQPLSRIAQSSVGAIRWDAIIAAVVAVRSARTSTVLVERNLVALAVLLGAPLGEVAALLGIAPSTLSQQLAGTDVQLLGEKLIRAESGQWRVA